MATREKSSPSATSATSPEGFDDKSTSISEAADFAEPLRIAPDLSEGLNETTTGATPTTATSVRGATQKVCRSAAKTKHQATKAIHKTKEVVETNIFCAPLRCIWHFPKNWPRTHAMIFGVVIPLWILIVLALGLGVLLVQYESQPEIDGNDHILAIRAELAFLDNKSAPRQDVASICLRKWEENGIGLDDNDGLVEINRTSLKQALQNCSNEYLVSLNTFEDIIINNSSSEAFDSLSFNWNRCWLQEEFGGTFVFWATEEMINATRPAAQEDLFTRVWIEDQQFLFEKYLPANATDLQVNAALVQSIEEASGGDTCFKNLGGTAWFFFTIMTTVGYGNQAPVTEEGRALVAFAGIFALILFGAVLGLAGHVILAVFDDFVSRFWFAGCLSYPGVGVILWGSIWTVYAIAIARDVELWWQARLPEFYADLEPSDAVWFAFISASTIGLGDFYLQPEMIFVGDALKYSVVFMIGFVFLSTFFGKVAETLIWILPSKQNSLHARLKNTRILACWKRGLLPWETPDPVDDGKLDPDDYASPQDKALVERIEHLKQMMLPVENEEGDKTSDDDDTDNAIANQSSNLDLIQQQQDILRSLLAMSLAQQERANFTSPPIEAAEMDVEPELDVEREVKAVEPEPVVVSCLSLMEGVVVG